MYFFINTTFSNEHVKKIYEKKKAPQKSGGLVADKAVVMQVLDLLRRNFGGSSGTVATAGASGLDAVDEVHHENPERLIDRAMDHELRFDHPLGMISAVLGAELRDLVPLHTEDNRHGAIVQFRRPTLGLGIVLERRLDLLPELDHLAQQFAGHHAEPRCIHRLQHLAGFHQIADSVCPGLGRLAVHNIQDAGLPRLAGNKGLPLRIPAISRGDVLEVRRKTLGQGHLIFMLLLLHLLFLFRWDRHLSPTAQNAPNTRYALLYLSTIN